MTTLETLETAPKAPPARLRQGPLAGRNAARWLSRVRAVLPFILIIGLWWGIHAVFDPAPTRLVPPSAVVDAFFETIREGILPVYIARSLTSLAIGAGIAIIVGIPLGWLLGLHADVAKAVEPLLRYLTAISGIAWIPLFLVVFGFTTRTVWAVIIYTMLFPIVFNTMIGVRTVPTVLRDAARSMGASWPRLIRDVYVPGSFPGVMTGIRLSIGFGWRALIAGEFLAGIPGLGFMIFDGRTQSRIDIVMLGMILLGALWLLMDRLILRPIEEHTATKWGMIRQ